MKKTHILFIIYVCFKCVALNTPKVTIIPQSTAKIQENTVYQFTCSITVQTNWRSVMFFDSTIGSSTVALFFNQNGCLFVPLSSGFQDVYGITCGATLGTFLFTIKKVTEKHNNQTVTCQAQYGTGNDLDIFVSDSVVIMVIIPLTSISISPDTTLRNVKRDSPGPFRCIATSRPLSVILWRKARNGQNIEDLASHEEQISETIVDSYLNYTGNEADEGVDIYCIGQYNGTHIESKRVRLRIIYAPDTGPSIQQIPAGNIITGDNLMLTCTVSGGNPLPILSWNCTGIKTNKTKGSEASYSVAFTVNKANSNMICTCSVFYHPVLSYRPSVHHLLVVFYVPEKVPIIQQMPTGGIISGNKVQLACSTYGGNPLPILSWNCIGTLKNLTTGIMASYSVEFIVDKSDNNKVCSCIATHIISLYNPYIQHTLIVHYAPDTGPSIQQIPAGNIITGDNLMLTCTVSGGNPLPVLSWNCTGIKTNKTKGSEASYSVAFTVWTQVFVKHLLL
ncbi:nephrin-like [Mytilus edulis]|uniref:nephrin-like n=1 Tax=Mytilus edulis TaxID=6550 RepID=UPI0039F06434